MGIFDSFKSKPDVEKLKAKKDVKGLIKALGYKKEASIRRDAAEALRDVGDERAVEPLIQALEDRNCDVRWNAAAALQILNWKPEDDTKKAYHLIALRQWDKLVDLREPAVNSLIWMLKDDNEDIRKNTVGTLGKIGDTRAVEPLIQALHGEDDVVRRNAPGALGEIKDARAVEPLMEALKDKDSYVRGNAAYALREIGDARAVEPLMEALKDKDSYVRGNAAYALGEIGDARAVEPLIQASKQKRNEGYVEGTALAAAAKLGSDIAREALMQALKDERDDIREIAVKDLDNIGWVPKNDTEKAYYAYYLMEKGKWYQLAQLGEPAIEALIGALKPPRKFSIEIESVINTLGMIGDKKLADALLDCLFSLPEEYFTYSSGMISSLRSIFEDYTDLIVRIAGYKRVGDYSYSYPLKENIDALKRLCEIEGAISSNILHKVAHRNDIEVVKEATQYGRASFDTLSFEPLRKTAKEELERRGYPPYDASAYLDEKAWKL